MEAVIFGLIAMSISMLGVVIGVVNIMKKKTMFFFTLIICAVGCFTIEEISLLVNIWCGVMDDVWIGVLGVFACNFFLFSANYGAIDSVVDEHEFSISRRLVALVVPILIAAAAIAIFFIWQNYSMLNAIVLAILLVPAVPASYYNVKHLMLKEDTLGIIRATKPCDIMSLVFYLVTVIYMFAVTFLPIIYVEIAAVVLAFSLLGLALAAVRGIKLWEI